MESPRLTSATNAREAAKSGDPEAFERATRVPPNIMVDGKTLMQAVRIGMGLGESVEESIITESVLNESLSVEQLAHISDKALDDAYHYGLSTPGNNFGWLANIESATAAKRMIDSGITDVEAIANAIHDGWNKTAMADYMGKLQLDTPTIPDKKKKRYALAQQTYAQLPEVEKEKDRVVARAMLKAMGIVTEAPGIGGDWNDNPKLVKVGRKPYKPNVDDTYYGSTHGTDLDLYGLPKYELDEDLTPDQWNELRVADPKAYMGNKDYTNRRWWTLQFKKARAAAREKGAQRFEFPPGSKNSYMVAPDLANEDTDQPDSSNNPVRNQLNSWMDQDQKIKDPTQRLPLQNKAWQYITQNMDAILADKGADGKGSYPAAPYAAWLLVQHMDAYPQNQSKFLQQLEQSGLDPAPNPGQKGKLQFLKDRVEVNNEIIKLWNADKNAYKDKNGQLLTNPTVDVRDPSKFDDADESKIETSRNAALKNAVEAGNTLLVAAVNATNAQTQPSYQQQSESVNEATEKSTKAEAKYQAMPRNGQRCDHCTMWRPPHGCSAVSGKIAANGWCSYYKRSHRKDLDEALLRNDYYGGWIEGDGHIGYVDFGNGRSIWDGHEGYLLNQDYSADKHSDEVMQEGWVRFITDLRGSRQSLSLEGTLAGLRNHYRKYAQTVLSLPPGSAVYISVINDKDYAFRIPEQKREFMKLLGPQSQVAAQPQGKLQTESQLEEAASPVLFHYTGSVGAALNILKNNAFMLSISTGSVEDQYAPKGYNYFLSTTRSKVGGYHEFTGGTAVMFNLDGNWFNRRYPVKAINYWAGMDRGDRHSESEDRIFSREPTIPADAITAIHILLKEAGEFASPTTRQLMIVAKKRGLPTYLYSNENAWKLQDTKRAISVSSAKELIRGQKKTGYISTFNGKKYLAPWLELIFKKSRSELSKEANKLRYSLTYWNGGQFADDLGLRNEITNARKPGNSGYETATKIIAAMRKIGAKDIKDLLTFLHKKWDAEAQQPAKSDNAAQSAIAKIRAATAKKESIEEALDQYETHGWILPNRKVVYVGSEEHLSWLYDNDIDGYEEAFTQGYVRFVNLPNTFFLEGTLGSLKKLYRVYAASALSRPHIAVDVYDGNRGNATSSNDFSIPQEKTKFMQLLGPSSVGEHAGSIIGTVGGGNDYPDRQVAVFPWDRWVQPDTGGSEVDYVGELDEVNMSPGSLAKFAATPQAQAMTIGFEAEMLVPGLEDEDDDESDPRQDARNWDMTKDIKFPITRTWQDEVLNWYKDAGTGESDLSAINDDLLTLKQSFIDYIVEKNPSMIDEMLKPENLKVIAKKIYDDLGGRRSGWSGQREIRDRIADEPNNPYGLAARARAIFFTKTINELSTEDYEKQWKKFLKSENVKNISDWVLKYAEYGGGGAWFPYLKPNLQPDSVLTIKQLAKNWNEYSGFKTKISSGYHGAKRDTISWILEPDSSISGDDNGIELVSPPMPLQQGMAALDKFFMWAAQNGYYGNASTGFHVGVSLPEDLQEKVDPLKVIILLGDQYVLNLFDRSSNAYTKSMFTQIQKLFKKRGGATTSQDYARKLRINLEKVAKEIINRSMDNDRYVSVNIKRNYIEFRSAGGNFMEHIDDIKNTVLRYVQVMAIAADPQAYREEYAKKLYAMIAKHIPQGDDQLTNFTMYASGLIDQNVLKMRLQKRQVDKAQAAADAKSKVYRIWLGDPPYGSNFGPQALRFETPSKALEWAIAWVKTQRYQLKDFFIEPDDHSLPPQILSKPASGGWIQ